MTESLTNCEESCCYACGMSLAGADRWQADEVSVQAGDELFRQPAYTVSDCPGCGLLSKHPILSDSELSRYYAKVDFRKWAREGFYPTEALARREIETIALGGKVLDFGCSSGRFLAPFSKKIDCYGIETNREAAMIAESLGITMISLDDLHFHASSFERIFLIDVFEHFSDPTGVLRRLERALAPGGKLVIVTGNGDYFACRRQPAQYWYFRNVEHVSMLTQGSANYIARTLSLNLRTWSECAHYDPQFSQKLFQYLRHEIFYLYRYSPGWIRKAWRKVPFLDRVGKWSDPPIYYVGRDHVVAVFGKPEISEIFSPEVK